MLDLTTDESMSHVEIAVYAYLHGGYRTRNSIIAYFSKMYTEHEINHAIAMLFGFGKIETVMDDGIYWKVVLD